MPRSIARRIAAQHGLCLYATDAVMAAHAGRITPRDAPFLSEFRGEGFGPIVEDLLALPAEPGVVAEGFRRAAQYPDDRG